MLWDILYFCIVMIVLCIWMKYLNYIAITIRVIDVTAWLPTVDTTLLFS